MRGISIVLRVSLGNSTPIEASACLAAVSALDLAATAASLTGSATDLVRYACWRVTKARTIVNRAIKNRRNGGYFVAPFMDERAKITEGKADPVGGAIVVGGILLGLILGLWVVATTPRRADTQGPPHTTRSAHTHRLKTDRSG